VIASKIIGNVDYIEFISYTPGLFLSIVDNLKKKKINKVIILDVAIDHEENKLDELKKFAEILVIDHHLLVKDLNSEKIIFLKAKSELPASYMCYYLFSKIQAIPSWIPVLGILCDLPQKYTEKNAFQVFNDFNLNGKGDLWKEKENLEFAIAYFSKNKKKVYDLLKNAKSVDDTGFIKYSKLVRKEFDRALLMFNKNKEVYGDLVLCYLKLKYPVNEVLINKLSSDFTNKTLIFTRESSGFLSISSRRQDNKINCSDLLKNAVKNIPNSSAGGHFAAAGAKVPINFKDKFKENLIRIYQSMK
jgi:nanoRNase/pAp phosphatase (c-di-AMP/oligoRNAs hydrolase)